MFCDTPQVNVILNINESFYPKCIKKHTIVTQTPRRLKILSPIKCEHFNNFFFTECWQTKSSAISCKFCRLQSFCQILQTWQARTAVAKHWKQKCQTLQCRANLAKFCTHSGLVRFIHGVIYARWYMRDHLCLDDLCGWSMRDHPGRWSMRDHLCEMIYHRWSMLDDLPWIISARSCMEDHLSRDDLRRAFVKSCNFANTRTCNR